MKNKGKTWSRGSNSRLPFGVNVNLNLSIISFSRRKGTTVFHKLSYMFLDKKALLKIWLNPGLNLTIFQGTGPR